MAITAIISVMIVSFSTLISAQTRKNNLRADFLDSVIALRTDLQNEFAENNYDGTTLSYESGKYENIDTVVFSNITNTPITSADKIIKVTVTNNSLNESQSFTLISKVG